MFQVVSIGTQLTEALAGLERTREVLRERPEDEDPRRTVALPRPAGRGRVRGRRLRLRAGEAGAGGRLLPGRAGHGDRARGPVGRGQVHHHRPASPRSTRRTRGRVAGGRRRPRPPCGSTPTARSSASSCRRRSSSTARSARTWPSRGRARPRRRCWPPAGSRAWTSSPSASRGLRDDRGRARRQALRRPAAARLHRARASSPTRAS